MQTCASFLLSFPVHITTATPFLSLCAITEFTCLLPDIWNPKPFLKMLRTTPALWLSPPPPTPLQPSNPPPTQHTQYDSFTRSLSVIPLQQWPPPSERFAIRLKSMMIMNTSPLLLFAVFVAFLALLDFDVQLASSDIFTKFFFFLSILVDLPSWSFENVKKTKKLLLLFERHLKKNFL